MSAVNKATLIQPLPESSPALRTLGRQPHVDSDSSNPAKYYSIRGDHEGINTIHDS